MMTLAQARRAQRRIGVQPFTESQNTSLGDKFCKLSGDHPDWGILTIISTRQLKERKRFIFQGNIMTITQFIYERATWPLSIHPSFQTFTSSSIQIMSPSKDGRMLLAIQAVELDQIKSIRSAARQFNVSRTTLGEQLKGRPSRKECIPNLQILTPYEETAII
jgi:hypothetical protein